MVLDGLLQKLACCQQPALRADANDVDADVVQREIDSRRPSDVSVTSKDSAGRRRRRSKEAPPAKTHKEKAAIFVKQAEAAEENKKWDEAHKAYSQAITEDPSNAASWSGRGLASFRRGKVDQALADLDQAIRLDVSNLCAWGLRAEVKIELGDKKGALADYDHKLSQAPADGESRCARGQLRLEANDAQGAMADFQVAKLLKHPGAADLLRKAEQAAHQTASK